MHRGRPGNPSPSARELDIMSVLWDRGSGTVVEVRNELIEREEFEPAHTTVLAQLRSLRAKRWVRVLHEDRAHRFVPVMSRDDACSAALRRVVILYFGSREALLNYLVRDRGTFPAVLKRVRRVLDERIRTSR
ncbi:MAG: BlaI/MecI/CopY family transcriptional regulator [Gemmatimonadales bacterium]